MDKDMSLTMAETLVDLRFNPCFNGFMDKDNV